MLTTVEDRKRAAAHAAVGEIEAGMVVGLGTGTTAAYAIIVLAERVAAGLAVKAVATSRRTETAARAAGIEVLDFADLAEVDLCIDGVDAIDTDLRAIKGAGGALLREKIVASAATRMVAIADASKAVDELGGRPLPLEILPFATAFVMRKVVELGTMPALRLDPTGAPWRTDQGNHILDCPYDFTLEPRALAVALAEIPGLLGHGLFLDEIDAVYLADAAKVERHDRMPRLRGGNLERTGILRPGSSLGDQTDQGLR